MASPLARGLHTTPTDAELRGFWNNNVLANTAGVLLAILAALRA